MKKKLYIECNMGAAGDMLAGALYELLSKEKQEEFIEIIKKIPLDKVRVKPIKVEKSGVYGTHMQVMIDGKEEADHHSHEDNHDSGEEAGIDRHHHDHAHDGHHGHDHSHDHYHGYDHHHDEHCHKDFKQKHDNYHHHHGCHSHDHSDMGAVSEQIDLFAVSDKVKTDAKAVYDLIAKAEAEVHQKSVDLVHFHEVGSLDAIVDVVSVCWMMDVLSPQEVIVSDINVGYGSVMCAHGRLPVPVPAVVLLLEGAPCYQGEFEGEMCTPTGAALLQYLKTGFGKMPPMILEKVGYGMGSKDFSQVNCLRAFLGREKE